MSTYRSRLQMSGVVDRPLDVYVDLDRDNLAMRTREGEEIGTWPLDIVDITGRDEGFTVKIHGVPAWVRTDNDSAFAHEVGLDWAPPRRRRCGCHRQGLRAIQRLARFG